MLSSGELLVAPTILGATKKGNRLICYRNQLRYGGNNNFHADVGDTMFEVTTTRGESFTAVEHVDLARLIHKRFGRNNLTAVAAWRRLLENDTTVAEFEELLYYEEHTPHCDEGYCIHHGGDQE